jgi:MSHA biogenesis protein MshO
MKMRGFTLIELIMVIMITGILAATLTVFLKPAVDGYFDTRRRGDLTDMADTALRRIAKDIRGAVPNSVRQVSTSCIQLVPTIAGGRYRMAFDSVNDPGCTPPDGCSAPLDVTTATTVFDSLSPMATVPAKDDWVVIYNAPADAVYDNTNRGQISATPTVPARAGDGLHRITIGSTQFPSAYDGGRFVVVPDAEKTLIYSCTGNTLYRKVTSSFAKADGTACTAASDGAIVATDIESCEFAYNPNAGATQQSGFVWMRIELKRAGESVALAHGVHVDNVP